MRTLIINFKNYRDVGGEGSVNLARVAETVSKKTGQSVIVVPPLPMLALVASKVGIPVFGQTASIILGEKTTGALTPEALRGAGAAGTLLNHSEARMPRKDIAELVPRLKKIGLKVCLCARTSREVSALAEFRSDYLAVEPPELIGSGVAVSKANPALVYKTVKAARSAGYEGKVLCGAGISDGADVRKAIELGADGVLVSSGVVKAPDWTRIITELANSLI